MPLLGITALVPPELVYACGWTPMDLNNPVPTSGIYPRSKLCAWTASWREMLITRQVTPDALCVVAGGDCHNSLVDGQKAARSTNLPVHYFFYPFSGDRSEMRRHIDDLTEFLGGVKDTDMISEIYRIKRLALELDELRAKQKVLASKAFPLLISSSDLRGDPECYEGEVRALIRGARKIDKDLKPVALIGVPPIYPDFHETCESLGLLPVFDELPYEFVRLGAKNIGGLSDSYAGYSFARPLEYRLGLLKKELKRRKAAGVIHYTQYACHHILEDDLFREELGLPMLTVQGDLPRRTDEQLKLRLEAFYESL